MAATMLTSGIQSTAPAAVQVQLSSVSTTPANPPEAKPASAPAPAAGTAPSPEESAKQLAAAVQSLQSYLLPDRTATLQVDKGSDQTYVKIVDAKTKQTILQIPPSDALAMAQKLQQMANPHAGSGVLVDQQG